MSDERYGDAGLRLLFKIQDACPEAGVASGLLLGAEILLKEFEAAKLQVREIEFQLKDAREAIKVQRREVEDLRTWARQHWDADSPLLKKLDDMLYTPFSDKRDEEPANNYRCLMCGWVSTKESRPLSRGTKVGCPKCGKDAEYGS
jgi:hypothetical protein